MGTRTVSQTINLQTPDQTSKYISADNSGLMIYDGREGTQEPSNPSATTNNVFIDDNSLDIRRGSDVLATFGADGAVIGKTAETRAEIDYHSLRLIDKEGNVYLHVSDLREDNGYARITQHFTGDGIEQYFVLYFGSELYDSDILSVLIDGETVSSSEYEMSGVALYFRTAPPDESDISVTYQSDNETIKAYTFGKRIAQSDMGPSSFAAGVYATASGYCSFSEGYQPTASGYAAHAEGELTTSSAHATHAEGYNTIAGNLDAGDSVGAHAEGFNTIAIGMGAHAEGRDTRVNANHAHAEGYYTQASGETSHSQNAGTIAQRKSQTALGEYNIADTTGTTTTRGDYAVIVGNGTADDARSNALTVDWNGKVECGDYSGNFKSIFNIFYPKGSYYETHLPSRPSGAVEPFNPSASDLEALGDTWFDPNYAWGGTWVLDSAGKVTVAYDSSDTDFDIIGDSGGSKTHMHTTGDFTLQAAHIPAHTHNSKTITASFSGRRCGNDAVSHWGGTNTTVTASSTANTTATTAGTANKHQDIINFSMAHTHDSVGGDQAHNHGNTGNESNVQPYVVVNRWHRTA